MWIDKEKYFDLMEISEHYKRIKSLFDRYVLVTKKDELNKYLKSKGYYNHTFEIEEFAWSVIACYEKEQDSIKIHNQCLEGKKLLKERRKNEKSFL